MVSVGVKVTTVEARVCVVLIQSLSLSKVDPRVVFPQPVAILHLCLPGHVYQLKVTSTTLRFKHTEVVAAVLILYKIKDITIMHMVDSLQP